MELQTFGQARSIVSVTVKAQVTEMLREVHFTKGQDIKQGNLLFTIERRPFDSARQRAQATLDRDRVQFKNLQDTANKVASLFKAGTATKNEMDNAAAAADAAAATVRADEADLEKAQLDADHCTIRSPIHGVAGDVLVNAGNVVKANDMDLVVINQVSPIQVFFSIPEAQLPAVRQYLAAGQLKVRARLADEPGQEGQLTFIDNQVDMSTGTVKMAATFANAHRQLWPGQFVRVTLSLTVDMNATVVPAKALQTGRQGKYVFVVKGDKAQLRQVQVQRTVGADAMVVGVQPGEMIVTDGQMSLADGSAVQVRGATSQPASQPTTGAAGQATSAAATLPALSSPNRAVESAGHPERAR